MLYRNKKIALIVPCYNEETTIKKVINDFKQAMPEMDVYVFDNMSKDHTKKFAIEAGAKVCDVNEKGKGNVVRRMFADVEADIYVMVDGDATYEASAVSKLVDLIIEENMDMVVGCRTVSEDIASKAYRVGHQFGNKMLTKSVTTIFGGKFTDMLSGYRAFSRRYVKSFPALSRGFETETELTVHALELRMPYGEVSTTYLDRPDGSESKLSTYRDGINILKTIIRLFMREKPLIFFGLFSIFFFVMSVFFAIPVFYDYLETGLVPKLPTAVLSAALMIASFVSLSCGLILDCITIARQETKRLSYLSVKSNQQ